MAVTKNWVITTSGDRRIHDIAKDLADAGLKDGKVLEEIGSITGSAEERVVEKLRKVKGVTDVSPDIEFQLPPPDSTIQ
jgi:hypothetical protein